MIYQDKAYCDCKYFRMNCYWTCYYVFFLGRSLHMQCNDIDDFFSIFTTIDISGRKDIYFINIALDNISYFTFIEMFFLNNTINSNAKYKLL